VLNAGDFTTVKPGEYHWFQSLEDSELLEIYYPQHITEDIVRKTVGGMVS
jgi:quercetin dioxygenase-like cupin family protein